MELILCRHGESHGGIKENFAGVADDSPLTKKGLKQTFIFIKIFKKYGVQKVYYSPKERARKIAEIIDQKLKIPYQVIPELSERNWGKWGNEPWEIISKRLDKLSLEKRYKFTPPDGESWKHFEKRLLKAMRKIEAEAIRERYKTVAIVTHRGSLRALFYILLKANIKKLKKFSIEVGSCFILSKKSKSSYSLEILNSEGIRKRVNL